MDSTEEHIANGGIEVWSIRLGEAARTQPPAPPPPASRREAAAPPPPPAPRREPDRPVAPAPPRRPAPAAVPDTLDRELGERPSSLVPRMIVIATGLLVIAFAAWWYIQNRGALPFTGTQETNETTVGAVDTSRAVPDTSVRDTTTERVATPVAPATRDTGITTTRDTTLTTPPRPQPQPARTTESVPPPSTGAVGAGGTQLVSGEDIQLMQDLERRFDGWFIIHISSFQTSRRARDEVAFLQSHEFPAFIVFLDLGPKGKWYRVYSGPFETRDEAQEVKKNLDAIPQVRFTRIASIPD